MIPITRSSFFTVVPPFIVSYLIFDWAEAEHNRYERLLTTCSDLVTFVSGVLDLLTYLVDSA